MSERLLNSDSAGGTEKMPFSDTVYHSVESSYDLLKTRLNSRVFKRSTASRVRRKLIKRANSTSSRKPAIWYQK